MINSPLSEVATLNLGNGLLNLTKLNLHPTEHFLSLKVFSSSRCREAADADGRADAKLCNVVLDLKIAAAKQLIRL